MEAFLRSGNIKLDISIASLPKSVVLVDGHELIKDWEHVEVLYSEMDEEDMDILSVMSGDIEIKSRTGHYTLIDAAVEFVSERMALISFDGFHRQ